MRTLVLLFGLALSGCLSAEEIEANKIQRCTNLGAAPGTANYYDCRLRLEAIEAEENYQRRAEFNRFAEIERAKQEKEHMDAVFSANPKYAACKYHGNCDTGTRTTDCRQTTFGIRCKSY